MKTYLSIWSLLLFSSVLLSQDMTYRLYGTNDYMAELRKDRSTLQKLSQLERDMNKTLRFVEYNYFLLPIVFHVLYDEESQKVSEEKIAEQLEILNEAFSNGSREEVTPLIDGRDRRNLEGYKRIREDTRVAFCFPANGPQNKPTTGVNYEKVKIAEWTDYFSMKYITGNIGGASFEDFDIQKKVGVKPWNTERYINVWVVNLPDTVAGFAQMPNGPKELDGIVIDYRYIEDIGDRDSPYNGGHTLTHLMGNYLGLLPLWGKYPCGDDYVDDTPIHNAPNFVCPEVDHISTCSGNPTEMSNNFMDNTFDACLEMFTQGQMSRIQKVLHPKGPRGKLGTSKRTQCATDLLAATPRAATTTTTYKSNLLIRPNPARNVVYIELQLNDDRPTDKIDSYSIEIYSISGQLIHRTPRAIPQSTLSLDVGNWQAGLYIVKVQAGGEHFSKRMVVQ